MPYPVTVENEPEGMRHWDPDCWLIGDTYYSLSGGENPPVLKSKDLKTWQYVGDFLQRDLPDVAIGEDVSCANFFPLGDKWMLLCIAHHQGCRYYLGDWDAEAEQFVPERHARMNFRCEFDQTIFGTGDAWRADFFAPESVLTPDGRRVMWVSSAVHAFARENQTDLMNPDALMAWFRRGARRSAWRTATRWTARRSNRCRASWACTLTAASPSAPCASSRHFVNSPAHSSPTSQSALRA